MSDLTPKQRRFVSEYRKDLNATQAAIRAGYSKKTARQQGERLLSNVDIATLVAKKTQEQLDKADLTAEKVISEVAKLAFANMLDYMTITQDGEAFVDLSKLTREQAAAIQEITVDETGGGAGDNRRERVQRTRFKLADKKGALELLCKHFALLTEKLDISGELKALPDDELDNRLASVLKEMGFASA